MTEVEFNFSCQRNTHKTLSAAQSLELIIYHFFYDHKTCQKEAKTPIIKTLQALLMCSLETFRTWSEASIWKTKGLACGQARQRGTAAWTNILPSSSDRAGTQHMFIFPAHEVSHLWCYLMIWSSSMTSVVRNYLFYPKAKNVMLLFVLKLFETQEQATKLSMFERPFRAKSHSAAQFKTVAFNFMKFKYQK